MVSSPAPLLGLLPSFMRLPLGLFLTTAVTCDNGNAAGELTGVLEEEPLSSFSSLSFSSAFDFSTSQAGKPLSRTCSFRKRPLGISLSSSYH